MMSFNVGFAHYN